jgi:predicted oxidoreductase
MNRVQSEASLRQFSPPGLPRPEPNGYASWMQTILLGSSALRTSRLAYGCWRVARADDPMADFQTTRAAVFAALEAGYTLFDHADIYCDGRSEEVFGRLLRENPGLRDRMLIATKSGIRFAGEPAISAPYRYDASAAHIIARCERSLQRLGIDTIDVLQIHRPDWLMNAEEVATAFERLSRDGKVREFGVSNFAPSQVDLLQQALPRPLVCQQVEISLAQLGAFTNGTLDQCQMRNITPLAWSPLAAGLLGDGATSLLRAQEAYQPAPIVIELDAIAREREISRTAVAIAWLLKHPAAIVPIIGSVNPEHIRTAATASTLELTREEWYRLLAASRTEPLS